MKPPKKLWKLLELAMTDLAKAERSKKFDVDMSEWMSTNGKCSVCLAGSVMAFSLDGVAKCEAEGWTHEGRKSLGIDYFPGWDGALLAIDSARSGMMFRAYDQATGMDAFDARDKTKAALRAASFDDPDYHKDKTTWKRQMRKSIRTLKEANV